MYAKTHDHSLLDPSCVTNLGASADSSSSIVVTWEPPTCRNGIITRYYLYYVLGNMIQTTNINNDGYTVFEATPSDPALPDSISFTILNLTAFTNYTIHVIARVEDIIGEVDTEVVERTFGDPPTAVPMPPPTTAPVDTSTPSRILYFIGDPRNISTGRVM